MGVVLDLPEPLIEAFPLVGLPVLVLALIIREQVLGSQEGPGGRNHRSVPGEQGTLGKKTVYGVDTYVSCVPKKKMGYLLGGGFTAPSAMSSIYSERQAIRGLQVRAGKPPVTWGKSTKHLPNTSLEV